ncbi:MAG: hypothetical protein MUC97_14310 [Bernardetiaceae bacterium]|jgi:hypothetical protein|nr:hypothetical protein [Bernardetiaceae bacterium]
MKKCGLILLSLALATTGLAQGNFQVLALKGSVQLDGQGLRVGTRLAPTQQLVVGQGAYLSLAHKSGKAMEIPAGTYQVQDLEQRLGRATGTTNQYARFVLNELTNPGASPEVARQRAKHMKKTGAVVRALGGSGVVYDFPLSSPVYGRWVALRWHTSQERLYPQYKVIISDLSEAVLHTQVVQLPQLMVDLEHPQLAKAQQLIFKVLPLNAQGEAIGSAEAVDGCAVQRVDPRAAARIRADLADLQDEEAATTALGQVMQASYFEEKGFYADAVYAYEKALELSGGAEQYQLLYQAFMARGGWGNGQ